MSEFTPPDLFEQATGVEPEETAGEDRISSPFDPTKIKVTVHAMTIDLLLKRIRAHEIDLAPDFQRKAGIWTPRQASRLIESILIRIPLPAFYMDATDENRWVVVDGLQRLTVLSRFVVEQSMGLHGLEFLSQFEGKRYVDLPRPFQRRIDETQVTVYTIEPPTPPEARFNIFKRINTGGMPLTTQEVRHALNPGPVMEFLKELAESSLFIDATNGGVSPDRMDDRECVLRFCAFWFNPYEQYTVKEFDSFLNDAMAAINKMTAAERQKLGDRFRSSMERAKAVFDRYAFRKRDPKKLDRSFPINKALFEAWSVNLARLDKTQAELLVSRRDRLTSGFIDLLAESDFAGAISQGTGDVRKVQARFGRIERLMEEVLA